MWRRVVMPVSTMNSGTSGNARTSTSTLCQSASPIRSSTMPGTTAAETSAGTARVRYPSSASRPGPAAVTNRPGACRSAHAGPSRTIASSTARRSCARTRTEYRAVSTSCSAASAARATPTAASRPSRASSSPPCSRRRKIETISSARTPAWATISTAPTACSTPSVAISRRIDETARSNRGSTGRLMGSWVPRCPQARAGRRASPWPTRAPAPRCRRRSRRRLRPLR